MNYLKYISPSFVDAYKMAFTNFTNFDDRSRRSEYWKFVLAYYFIAILLFVVGISLNSMGFKPDILMGIVFFVFWAIHLCPSLALCARRLHDSGHTSKWILATIIPVIGCIVSIVILLWLMCDSEREDNEWGESPKYYVQEAES